MTQALKSRPAEQNAVPVSYAGKILPNQEFNNNLYEGKKDYMQAMFELLCQHSEHVSRTTFKLTEHARVGFEEMSTPPMQLSFLEFLVDVNRCKTFLEIGTFVGNTAMHIAKHIGPEADVVTIEKFDEFADIAQQNFDNNGFGKQITLLRGDANVLMRDLKDNYFDLIYVDGDKGKYLELTQIAEKKVSKNGIILIDDVFFHGDALNDAPKTDKGNGCKKVLEHYRHCTGFSKHLLPLNNGILLLKKMG